MQEMVVNSTKIQDPVFIAIYTEGDPARESGISILDTRDLKHVLFTSKVLSGSLIWTFNYRLQRHERAEFERPFQFGTSRMIDSGSVPTLLQKIFRTGHPLHQETRNTILVGHSVDGDILSLRRVKNRKWPSRVSLRRCIQYLYPASPESHFGGPAHKRMETLPTKLRVPYKFLYNGGNDSNFTLKALLAPALWDCPFDKQCSPEMQARKKIIRVLAQIQMPSKIADHLEPIPIDLSDTFGLSNCFQADWHHANPLPNQVV
jgi:hypothetical protein